MFCSYEKCQHYGNLTSCGEKCYYEPQCWRGKLHAILSVIKIKNDKVSVPDTREDSDQLPVTNLKFSAK